MNSSPTQNPEALPQGNSNECAKETALPKGEHATLPQEFGGSNKPEPTRYGDWEIAGKCVDF